MNILIYFAVVIVLTLIITPRVFPRRVYRGPAVRASQMPCTSSGGAVWESTLLDEAIRRNSEPARDEQQEAGGILVDNWPVYQKKE